MAYGTLAVCVLVCMVPLVWGQQVFRWKVQDYPDPFSFDTYSQCGRSNKSNICDPNNIISKREGQEKFYYYVGCLLLVVFLCYTVIQGNQAFLAMPEIFSYI